jgi:hypothetical protein
MAENTITIEFRGDDEPTPTSAQSSVSAPPSAASPERDTNLGRNEIQLPDNVVFVGGNTPAPATATIPDGAGLEGNPPVVGLTPDWDDDLIDAVQSLTAAMDGASWDDPPPSAQGPDIRENALLDDAFGVPRSPTDPAPPVEGTMPQPEKRGATPQELAVLHRNQKRVEAEQNDTDGAQQVFTDAYTKARRDDERRGIRESEKRAQTEIDAEGKQPSLPDKMRTVAAGGQQVASGGVANAASGVMQIASTGMLGSSMAALAAGPVGAMVAVAPAIYEAAKAVVAMPFEGARKAAQGMADAGTAIMENDLSGLMGQLADGLSSVSPVLGEVAKTANAFQEALNQVTQATIKRGKELSAYDSRPAVANATADVRRIRADMREAQTLGGEYARVTSLQSDVEDFQREVLLFLKSQLLPLLIAFLEPMAEGANTLKPMLKALNDLEKTTGAISLSMKISPIYWIPKLITEQIRLIRIILEKLGVLAKEQEVDLFADIEDAASLMRDWVGQDQTRSSVEPLSPGM